MRRTHLSTGTRTHGACRRVLLLCVAASAASVHPSFAQCPDGSPSPCGGRPAAPPPNSVAVLYLDNVSRDTADAYLADGLTEEIIIRLGQVQRLDVKSRFEVQRLRGRAELLDPTALGRQLRAAYLVIGSVQRVGARVRLRVELVLAATRAQVWGNIYDRASDDLLDVEADIARAVATGITGQLLPQETSRLARPVTSDPVAFEEYLRGLVAEGSSFNEAQIRNALAHFDRAIARDSALAGAYAGKAAAWVALADAYVPPADAYRRAREAARQALARDSTQADAYAILSNAAIALDLDAHEAERLARRGLALDPRDALAGINLSMALLAQGRLADACAEARLAWRADSLTAMNGVWYADACIHAGELDSAAAILQRVGRYLSPVDVEPMEGRLWMAHGDPRRAEPLLNWRYYGGLVAGTYVRALLARGDTTAARAALDSMLVARRDFYFNPIALARVYAALGDLTRGMEWLRRAVDERTLWVEWIRVDDELAPLRADPSYAALDRLLKF